MSIARRGSGTVSQFALVSYVPVPLSAFLDDLRIRLTPEAKPRAHVTVLPPRPLHSDLEQLKARLRPLLRDVPPIWIELGSIRIFPVSNVIYLSIEAGESELRDLNRKLDRDELSFQTAFPYHPHITLAQDIPMDSVEKLRDLADRAWRNYKGDRGFLIESLWLVQNVVPDVWLNCGMFKLAVEAPVPG